MEQIGPAANTHLGALLAAGTVGRALKHPPVDATPYHWRTTGVGECGRMPRTGGESTRAANLGLTCGNEVSRCVAAPARPRRGCAPRCLPNAHELRHGHRPSRARWPAQSRGGGRRSVMPMKSRRSWTTQARPFQPSPDGSRTAGSAAAWVPAGIVALDRYAAGARTIEPLEPSESGSLACRSTAVSSRRIGSRPRCAPGRRGRTRRARPRQCRPSPWRSFPT
jgi:hypothetical protein